MKRNIIWILIAALLISMLPAGALAAKPSIKLGGKIGFMYEGGEVTLKPRLKGISAAHLQWSSSDPDSVSVEGGRITGNSVGRSVVTVSGGGASAKCGVVVLPKSLNLEVGDSYSLPYGTVEKYKMNDSSIAGVTSKGVITAKKAGSAILRVSYGRQKLYVSVQVSGGQQVDQSKAASLSCAGGASQIVLVEHKGGSKAELTIHEKKHGVWEQLYSCTAYVGANGIGKTREGDKKTPSGTYNLTQPFGIKADPGAYSNYIQVTKNHYWCGTSGSEYYNQLVDTRKVNRARTSSDEFLINYKGYYNYCMFIDYNKEGTAGKGSCIFLHCTGGKSSTAGCIAVPEKVMKNIICWAKPGCKIVIQ